MPASNSLDQVKDLLANGQTEEAADLLLSVTTTDHINYHGEAVLLKNRLETLQQHSIGGVLSQSDESIEWARISRAIIGLVDNIAKGEQPKSEEELRKELDDRGKHQLAAILFTDIVGYTGIMEQDERLAIAAVKRHQQVLEANAAVQGGQVLQYYGDGSLSIFQSAIQAVRCAMEIQKQLQRQPKVPLRIGIHIGEVLLEGGNVFGDGVNVASRIETLGIEGAVLFSKEVYRKIRNHPEFKTISLGLFEFKGVDEGMEVFAICNEDFPVPKREEMQGKLKPQQPERRFFSTGKLVAAVLLGILLAVAGWKFWYEPNLPTGPEVSLEKYSGKVVFALDRSPVPGAVVNFGNGLAIDTTGPDGVFSVELPAEMRDSTVYLQIFFQGERKIEHELIVDEQRFQELKIPN